MISSKVKETLEDTLLELGDYILATYGEHYAGETKVQTIDVWETNGTLRTTIIDTCIKYLMRYGKKDGYNKKDILKVLHFLIILYVLDHGSK